MIWSGVWELEGDVLVIFILLCLVDIFDDLFVLFFVCVFIGMVLDVVIVFC